MESIGKTSCQTSSDSSKSDDEKREQDSAKALETKFEPQSDHSNVEDASILDILDCFTGPSSDCSNVLSEGFVNGGGMNGKVGFMDEKILNVRPSTLVVQGCFEETKEVSTLQLEADKRGANSEKILLAAMSGSLPKQPESGSSVVVSREATRNLPDHTTDGDSSGYCENMTGFSVASLPQNRRVLQFSNVDTDAKGIDQELCVRDVVHISRPSSQFVARGSGELAGVDKNPYIHDELKTSHSGQGWKVYGEAQFFDIDSKVKKIEGNETHVNNISFKLPISKIPDTTSFGFSFGPRFEETSKSPRTQGLRPTLNPFKDIERQGRCSLLNHSRSPPGSRHHSRSSSTGLQAFKPFPLAMKISKETGDQPPKIPSPPLLSCGTRKVYESAKDVGSLEQTPVTELDPPFRDRSSLERGINGGRVLRSNVEPLDIKDFDILFSHEQKFEPYENSVRKKTRNSGSFNVKPALSGNLYSVDQSDFATLGAESVWMSSRIDRGKMMVEDQRKEAAQEYEPMDNSNTIPESD